MMTDTMAIDLPVDHDPDMRWDTPQLRHYGADVPAEEQPRCSHCGGYMTVHADWEADYWMCPACVGAATVPVAPDVLAEMYPL